VCWLGASSSTPQRWVSFVGVKRARVLPRNGSLPLPEPALSVAERLEQEFYLDLLFYNYVLRRFVVIDLKIEDFKPEFAGKMNFYLNAVKVNAQAAERLRSVRNPGLLWHGVDARRLAKRGRPPTVLARWGVPALAAGSDL
jgi:YhcG PDDEXK nuclease domain